MKEKHSKWFKSAVRNFRKQMSQHPTIKRRKFSGQKGRGIDSPSDDFVKNSPLFHPAPFFIQSQHPTRQDAFDRNPRNVVKRQFFPRITFSWEYTRCNRQSCTKCRDKFSTAKHGPYLFTYFYLNIGGFKKLITTYIGKIPVHDLDLFEAFNLINSKIIPKLKKRFGEPLQPWTMRDFLKL